MNIYDFTVKKRDGEDISLSEYRDKVLLVVNTATGCGFTPQYTELQALYGEFHGQGLEILVSFDPDLPITALSGIGQTFNTCLINSISSIRHQLPQKNIPVGVK